MREVHGVLVLITIEVGTNNSTPLIITHHDDVDLSADGGIRGRIAHCPLIRIPWCDAGLEFPWHQDLRR
jgi:hypothetical protein